MGTDTRLRVGVCVAMVAAGLVPAAGDVTVVHDGQAAAAIWRYDDGKDAAAELAATIEKISGARLEVKQVAKGVKPADGEAAVVVGQMALDLGLPAPPRTVSKDGYRIQAAGNRVLLAGEGDDSTFYAASHLLEALGCRWFFDNELGTVIPRLKTVVVKDMTVAEQPDFISRSIWGPNWGSRSWARHNRAGGLAMSTGHNWGWMPRGALKEHPEYYALREGQRREGQWLCTSNPAVAKLFAEAIIARTRGKGITGLSVSPPDGTGYCQCDACKAQDAPGYIEPSSGRTAVSDRYLRFFDAVGRLVAKECPDVVLNFYAYADYTVPPKTVRNVSPNLVVWIAPIRFCRMHSMGNPNCPPRQRCRGVVEGWAQAVGRVGWREYNYNLAECSVPFAKLSVWKDDVPYLKKLGCLGLNIESLVMWHLNGPNTYLVARMAWDADLDVDKVMDDFFEKFGGKAAGHLKAYWQGIDHAYRDVHCHAGSYYSLPAVWTPDLLAACQTHLDAAKASADSDLVRRRVEMFQLGLDNAKLYLAQRHATNACDFVRAKELYDKWLANMDLALQRKYHPVAEYKYGYAARFQGPTVLSGLTRTTGDCRKLVQLGDEWLFRYDPADAGAAAGWGGLNVAPDGWRKVRTYSACLDQQHVPEQLTWMWYRTTFKAPAELGDKPLHLWFGEIDGRSVRVYLNGQSVGEFPGRRRPGEVDVTGKVQAGRENTVAVRIDHSAISELSLGGILKPVMLYIGIPADAKP